MDVEFYSIAEELVHLLPDPPTFIHACECIHARIVMVTEERKLSGHPLEQKSERLEVAKALLNPYGQIDVVEEEAEKLRQMIRIYWTD